MFEFSSLSSQIKFDCHLINHWHFLYSLHTRRKFLQDVNPYFCKILLLMKIISPDFSSNGRELSPSQEPRHRSLKSPPEYCSLLTFCYIRLV